MLLAFQFEIPLFWIPIAVAALGSSALTAFITNAFNRRKSKADTHKTIAETETIHLSNDAQRLADLGALNKTISDLLTESERHIKKMREANSQLVAAQTENALLSTSVQNAKAIIDYQKTERHEWTEQLKNVLTALTEARLEIENLRQRVAELEKMNRALQA